MAVRLYAKRSGEGAPVLLLHGLFGAGNNLGALARSLQDSFEVFSLDLPNHGRSDWLEAPDLPSMADSLEQWMTGQDLAQAHLVGHSLGGKVAMQLALQCPARVRSLVVADIAPVPYTAHHEAVFAALNAVVAARCRSREAAAGVMAGHLEEAGVIHFLLMSLQRTAAGEYDWRFDLRGIEAAYPALLAAPQADHEFRGPVLFVKGGDSAYLQQQHWSPIQALFPSATLEVMPGCGHWLHVEEPRQFNDIVARFLVVA